MRSAPEPTLAGRIALTFLVLACLFAWLLRNNQVIFVTYTVLATVLLSGLLTHFSAARLDVRRQIPDHVMAGAPFAVRLRVRNLSAWRPALGLGFLDYLQVSEMGGTTRGPRLPVLPPRRAVEISFTKRIHRRGVYNFSNTLAATSFPFGIFERRVLLESPARLVVLPALGRLRRAARRDLAQRPTVPRAARRAHEGHEEFHSLREYRAGDNPRYIHWKTTARAGKLMRRVMHQEASEDLTILLDTCVDGLDAEIRRRTLEKAISCAATLLADAARLGRRAIVHFPDGSAGHTGTRGGLMPALEVLAGLKAGRTSAQALVAQGTLRRGSTALLLSLAGPAHAARRAAAERGLKLVAWDVAHRGFARYFGRR